MGKSISKWAVAVLCGALAACAFITVNIYFPEKEVKEAFRSLDQKLLHNGEGVAPPEGAPPSINEKKPGDKPQSTLEPGGIRLALVTTATAAENVANNLVTELSRMPEVTSAYAEMKGRLPELDALRDSGAVGESMQGLIAVRNAAKVGLKQTVVDDENRNRKAVITGMARAILKINNQPETPENLNQLLGKAAASYAGIRQEEARQGWWVQLPNSRWVQK